MRAELAGPVSRLDFKSRRRLPFFKRAAGSRPHALLGKRFLFDLLERTTVCSVVICPRLLRRRDDKQNGPNKYGQQNRPGDPNQTPGQQTKSKQSGLQGGGQQRDPRRQWKRTARFDEQFC